MSKAGDTFFALSVLLLSITFAAVRSSSQSIEAVLRVDAQTETLTVSGRTLEMPKGKNLSFLKSAIGAKSLATRISRLTLAGSKGDPVASKEFIAGEYVADSEFVNWSYDINLAPLKDPRSSAHASWISDRNGVLMLDDLLPKFLGSNAQGKISANISIETPTGWKVVSAEKATGSTFRISNVEKSVFVIGEDLRVTELKGIGPRIRVVTSGNWLFTDAEAAEIANDIYGKYVNIFGSTPTEVFQFSIIPFPQKDVQKGTWEAETLGSSVLVVSADMPFKTQSLQRLHEQLRHEIFHIWLPNGVNLTGNYDWFYEGFALYRSLKAGVEMNQIRFDDLLDTLSRAYNIDSIQGNRPSLIAASQDRLNGSDTQLYARGMLVAFLCDLSLLENSRGKASVDKVLRSLYDTHRFPNSAVDANTAILKSFSSYPQLDGIVDNYIRGTKTIEWNAQLELAGIEHESGTSPGNLRVKVKLTGRQKAILDELGYNSWRKLTRKS